MEEFYFKCEICGKSFPAIPDALMDIKFDVRFIDKDTGETILLDENDKNEYLETLSKDHPKIKPFMKPVICMCSECQTSFITESTAELPTTNKESNPKSKKKRSKK